MSDRKVVSKEHQKKSSSSQIGESGPNDPRFPPDIPTDDIPLPPRDDNDTDIPIPIPRDDIDLIDSNTLGSSDVYDIVRLRANNSNKYYSALEDTNYSRGDVLKKACAEAESGDILQLNIGIFELNYNHSDENKNTDLTFPLGVKIRGRGIGYTTLLAIKDGDGRCLERNENNKCTKYKYVVGMPFQLTNSIVEDLTIICDAESKGDGYEEDAKAIGYAVDSRFSVYRRNEQNEVITYSSKISRCRIVSNAWGFYSWNNYGDRCDFFDCEIISGRQGISMMGWGANSANNEINIYRCKFIINGKKPDVGGDLSKLGGDCYRGVEYPAAGGVYGVVCRSGKVKVIDCDFHLTASKTLTLPRCVGISDTFTSGSKESPKILIQSFNNRFYITSYGARDSYAHLKMKEQSTLYSQNNYVEGGMMNNLFLSSNSERQQDDEPKEC